ncbi:MAG: hypothetical protein ACP5LU_04800 [Desulfurella sp.]|uniref:hypothetical protein n=1 Tax=Desulfurella sp. TaxID=1962857 RepID=UPI003D1331C0
MKKGFFVFFNIIFLFGIYGIVYGNTIDICKVQFDNKNIDLATKSCEQEAKANSIDGFFYLGRIYLNLNHPKTAINFFKKAQQLPSNLSYKGKIYRYMAIAYLNLYLQNKFLYYRDVYLNTPDIHNLNLYVSMNDMVALHLIHKLFSKSIFYFHKSLKTSSKDYRSLVFNDLAYTYFFDNKISKALFFEKKAIKNAQRYKDFKDLPLYLFNISYFRYIKNQINDPTKKQWQENFNSFLAHLKRYVLKLSTFNGNTQISKIINNVEKINY